MRLRIRRLHARRPGWLAVGGLVLTSLSAFAYLQIISDVGRSDVRVRWRTTQVEYAINQAGTDDIPGDQEFAAIRASFQTWEDVESSLLQFGDGPLTDAGFVFDGTNTVVFVDSPLLASFGVLAFTNIIYTVFDGSIVETDIVMNDAFDWSLVEETDIQVVEDPFSGDLFFSGPVNLPDVLTHEIGHVCGLDHTFVDFVDPSGDPAGANQRFVATMYPYADDVNGSAAVSGATDQVTWKGMGRGMRSLEEDDMAGVSHIYPAASFVNNFGTISGKLTNALKPGEPVFGAHVIAIHAESPFYEAVSAMTLPTGDFLIDGLKPGPYFVMAEPALFLDTISSFFANAETNFLSEFYAEGPNGEEVDAFTVGTAGVLDIQAGTKLTGIDFDVFVGFGEGDPNEDPPEITNDSFTTATLIARDTETLGVIDPRGDVDFFRFAGNRGDVIGVEVVAQRIGSRLQPRLSLFDQPSAQPIKVSENYPGLGGDARIEYELPTAGTYYVKVEDLRGNVGGEEFVYVLKIQVLSRVIPLVANSDPASVLDLPMGVPPSAHSVLEEMTIQFIDKGEDGDFGPSDFLPITPASGDLVNAGIAVYDDSGLLGNGRFNYDPSNPSASDEPLPLASEGYVLTPMLGGFQITFRFADTAQARVPQSPDSLPDFFVVVRTSNEFRIGDDFRVRIPPNGIVVRDKDTGNLARSFSSSFPSHPNTYISDPIRLVNFTDIENRIDVATRAPVSIIGIDARAPATDQVVLSEVAVTLVGFSHRLIPGPLYGSIADMDEARLKYNFESGDLAAPQVAYASGEDDPAPGGISVFRDSEDPRGISGLLDPTTDLLLPVASIEGEPIIEEIPAEDIPIEIIENLFPLAVQQDPIFQFWLEGGSVDIMDGTVAFSAQPRTIKDLIDTFGIRAFRFRVPIALPLDDSDMLQRALLPSDNTGTNRGADFFVTVSTSEAIRGLDSFIAYIAQDDVKMKKNLGAGMQRPIPSLAQITTDTQPEHVNLVVCRPRPRAVFSDRAADNPVIRQRGDGWASQPKDVIGINIVDYGQNFNIAPLQGWGYENAAELAAYFNQSPVIDRIAVRLLGEATPTYNTRILQGQSQTAPLDTELSLLDVGVSIWMDDDTPIGDFEDNDGDGLIDEELRNLIDDDMDGVIDEDDFGDDDGVGTNGAFDRTIDNPFPYYLFQRTGVPFNVNAFFNDAVTTTTDADGRQTIRIPLLQTRVDEIPLGNHILNIFSDPMTIGFNAIFLRPDFLPIWYVPNPTVNVPGCVVDLAWVNGEGGYNFGFYLDCTDLANPTDLLNLQYTYSYVIPIPDEDEPPFDGDDFFIVLRTGPDAQVNDKFRIQIPEDGIEYSVYQSSSVNWNGAYPGTLPDADFGGQTVLTVGHENVRPSIAIISPGTGDNFWLEDHLFTVRWTDNDPDDNAVINLFLTDQRGSLAKVKINPTPIFEDDITDQFNIDIADPTIAEALSNAGIFPIDEFDPLYVIAEINDGVHDPVVAVSAGPILLNPERFQPVVDIIVPASGEIRYFDRSLRFDAIKWTDHVSQSQEGQARVRLYFNFEPQLSGSIPITQAQNLPAVEDVRYLPDGSKEPASVPGVDEFVFDLTLQDLISQGVDVRDLVGRPIYIIAQLNDGLREPVSDISDGFIFLNADTLVGVLRYEKLLNTGSIVPSFGAPKFPTPDLVSSLGVLRFFRDMEIDPDETGAVVTNTLGLTVLSGSSDIFAGQVSSTRSTILISDARDLDPEFDPMEETVIDVEVDWERGIIYLATDLGRLMANREPPFPLPPGRWFGRDALVYPEMHVVDMVLMPDGLGLLQISANGSRTPVGSVPPGLAGGPVGSAPNTVDFALNPAGTGGVVLAADGSLFPVGTINAALLDAIDPIQDGSWLPAIDDQGNPLTAANSEITLDESSIVIMDSGGRVYAFGDLRLPPDRDFSRGFRDLELLAQGEEDIVDLIKRALRAFRTEDSATLLSLIDSANYRDVHGRDAERLRQSLGAMFDVYEMQAYGLAGDATPCASDYAIDFATNNVNPLVVVRSDDATATVQVCQTVALPQNLDVGITTDSDVGDEVVIPFTQRVTIFERGDGRGYALDIFDVDNPTGVFDRFLDRNIFDIVFSKEEEEGPWRPLLKYEGPTKNNLYVVRMLDPNLPVGEPDLLFLYYPEDGLIARALLQQEYTFMRDPMGFLVSGYQTLMDLPSSTGEPGEVGFGLRLGGPVLILRGAEADFIYSGGNIQSMGPAPVAGGVLDITLRLGLQSLDRFRYNDRGERLSWDETVDFIQNEFLTDAWIGDLNYGDLVDSEPVVVNHVYLVRLTGDLSRFGLAQVLAVSDDNSRILVDWFFAEELLLDIQ